MLLCVVLMRLVPRAETTKDSASMHSTEMSCPSTDGITTPNRGRHTKYLDEELSPVDHKRTTSDSTKVFPNITKEIHHYT